MKKIIVILTLIMAMLATTSCVLGVFSREKNELPSITNSYGEEIVLYQKGLYARDSISMASQAVAQDCITLFLCVPALLLSLHMAFKYGEKWFLFFTGFVGYFLYAYIPYAMMLAFNKCFLSYVLLISTGLFNFILCMIEIMHIKFPPNYFKYFPVKVLAVVQVVTGLFVGLMWMERIISAIAANRAPLGLDQYSTLVIQGMDLAIIVPVSFVCAYLLFKRNKIGYALYVILQVKGIAMALAVTAMNISMMSNGVNVTIMELSLFPSILLMSVVFLAYICWGISKVEKENL